MTTAGPVAAVPAAALSRTSIEDALLARRHPLDAEHGTDILGEVPVAPFVRPAVLTAPGCQAVAYYDAQRWLTVAVRREWGQEWTRRRLPSRLGWDSHNYASLGLDRDGCLHVAGNMHATPMECFRTTDGLDLTTFERLDTLVDGAHERRVTYPEFRVDGQGRLSFWFRDGASGNGVQRLYVYDEEGRAWTDPLPEGLIDGSPDASAYLDGNAGMTRPDGTLDVLWVWRDSPDAESTHSITMATGGLDDLRSVEGDPLRLPVRPGDALVAEPAPEHGLINNNARLLHAGDDLVLILGHLRDDAGRMQLVLWTWDGVSWSRDFLTDWEVTWDFGGEGTLRIEIEIGRPVLADGAVSTVVRVHDAFVTVRVTLPGLKATVTDGSADAWRLGGVPDADGIAAYCEPEKDRSTLDSACLWWTSLGENRDLEVETGSLPNGALRIVPAHSTGV